MLGRRWLAIAMASAMVAGTTGSATSATKDWRRHKLEGQPLSLSLPSQWKVTPRTERELRDLIAAARTSGNSTLARTYESGLSGLRRHAFQAFAWPQPNVPILTEVTVRVQTADFRITDRDLSAVVRVIAAELRSKPGDRISDPTRLRLPVGTVWRISGRVTAVGFGGAKAGVATYVFASGSRLYSVTGRTDSRTLATYRPIFDAVAASMRWR